jgi:hypothetical protein
LKKQAYEGGQRNIKGPILVWEYRYKQEAGSNREMGKLDRTQAGSRSDAAGKAVG